MALIDGKSLSDWQLLQLQRWVQLQPNANINPDSMISMDAYVLAEMLYLSQQDATTLINNAFLAYATGDELSNLGLDRGVTRKPATYATGVVTFARGAKATQNYDIPAGTVVSTQPSGLDGSIVTYQTTEDVTLYGQIFTPLSINSVVQITGGVIPNGTYHYVITAVGGDNVETDGSAVTTVPITNGLTTNAINLARPAVAGAASYNIYLGVWSDDPTKLGSSITPSYTDTVGSTTSMEVPPSENNTGSLTADANIQANIAGDSGNTAPNTVTQFVNKPTGVETVNNAAEITGGSNEEDDDTYRARIKDVLFYNTGKVTVTGYRQTAESVPGVASATVTIPVGGMYRNEITIIITAANETGIPSEDLLAQVTAVVNADDNRAVCDNITVVAPDVHIVNYAVTVIDYDHWYTEDQITTLIQDAMIAYFPTVPVGTIVYVVDIDAVIHSITQIIDFSVSTPSANITLGASEMAIAWTSTITFS